MEITSTFGWWVHQRGDHALRCSINGACELPSFARTARRPLREVFYDERKRFQKTQRLGTKNSYQTGLLGECVVADGLKNSGWKILAERMKTKVGEIDLIAKRSSTIVFIEVKTSGPNRIDAEMAVNAKSRTRIRRAAVTWMQNNPSLQKGVRHYRFDVFLVHTDNDNIVTKVDHIRDAF